MSDDKNQKTTSTGTQATYSGSYNKTTYPAWFPKPEPAVVEESTTDADARTNAYFRSLADSAGSQQARDHFNSIADVYEPEPKSVYDRVMGSAGNAPKIIESRYSVPAIASGSLLGGAGGYGLGRHLGLTHMQSALTGLLGAGVGGYAGHTVSRVTQKQASTIDVSLLITPAVKLAMFKASDPTSQPPNALERAYNGVKDMVGSYATNAAAQHVWDNNTPLRYGVYGAGIGAGAGLLGGLLSRKKDKWKSIIDGLTAGAAGGLVGGAAGVGKDVLGKVLPSEKPMDVAEIPKATRSPNGELLVKSSPVIPPAGTGDGAVGPVGSALSAAKNKLEDTFSSPQTLAAKERVRLTQQLAAEAHDKLHAINPKSPLLTGLATVANPGENIPVGDYEKTFNDLVQGNLADPNPEAMNPAVRKIYEDMLSSKALADQAVADQYKDTSLLGTAGTGALAHGALAAGTAGAIASDQVRKNTMQQANAGDVVDDALGVKRHAGSVPSTIDRAKALQLIADNPAALQTLHDRYVNALTALSPEGTVATKETLRDALRKGVLPTLPQGVSVDDLTTAGGKNPAIQAIDTIRRTRQPMGPSAKVEPPDTLYHLTPDGFAAEAHDPANRKRIAPELVNSRTKLTANEYDALDMGRRNPISRVFTPSSEGRESKLPLGIGSTATGRQLARGGILQALLLGARMTGDAVERGVSTPTQQKLVVDPATHRASFIPYTGK